MKIKTLAPLLISIFIYSESFGQTDTLPVNRFQQEKFDKEIQVHLKKYRSQKTVAWILLGSGLGLNTISASMVNDINYDNGAYRVLSTMSGLATMGSIPMFFIATNNKNKAQMLSFKKKFELAPTDSMRKLIVEDAAEYFSARASANKTPAIILSAAGGAFIIAGIASVNSNNGFWDEALIAPLYIASGITIGLLSIPFYIRAAQHQKTARMLLRTGRFPVTDIGTARPVIKTGRQVSIGIAFQL